MIIFILQNNFKTKRLFYSIFSLPALLLFCWLIKNIIVSGCAIYPIKITCIKNFSWTNIQQTVNVNTETEAWSKAWPDRINQNITMQEYNKNFNWLNTWSKKHLKYILKIIIPYMGVLFLIILYIKIKFKNVLIESRKETNERLFLCLIICLVGTLSFFFFFPLYRFGYSYIVSLISLLFILIIKNKLLIKQNISIFKFIFISCFIIIITKQGVKIYNNYKSSPWPNIYTLDFNDKIYPKKKIEINNNFTYYLADKEDQLCMYSKSPCTTYPAKNLKYSLKKTYSFLNVN
jgi:hypothetical protein